MGEVKITIHISKPLGWVNNFPDSVWNFSQWFLIRDSPTLLIQMILELNQPCMEPFVPATDLKVIIACAGATDAGRVCGVLERVGRNCETEGRLIYSWWSFDDLAIASTRKLAVMEAAASDMIVIAIHERDELPEEVIDWLGRCVAIAGFHPKGLVALLDFDRVKKNVSQVIISRLKEVAEWGRMDFFANGTKGELQAAPTGGTLPPPGNSSRPKRTGATRIAGRSLKVPAQLSGTCKQGEQVLQDPRPHPMDKHGYT